MLFLRGMTLFAFAMIPYLLAIFTPRPVHEGMLLAIFTSRPVHEDMLLAIFTPPLYMKVQALTYI